MANTEHSGKRNGPGRLLLPLALALLGIGLVSLAVAAEPVWATRGEAGPRSTIPAPEPFTISGLVFHDLNLDGDWQEGEPGIGGVLVTLDPGGRTYITNETDADGPIGGYWFGDIEPGQTYTITCAPVPGYVPTSPTQVTGVVISEGGTVPPGGTIPGGGPAVVHFGQRGAHVQRLVYIARNH